MGKVKLFTLVTQEGSQLVDGSSMLIKYLQPQIEAVIAGGGKRLATPELVFGGLEIYCIVWK